MESEDLFFDPMLQMFANLALHVRLTRGSPEMRSLIEAFDTQYAEWLVDKEAFFNPNPYSSLDILRHQLTIFLTKAGLIGDFINDQGRWVKFVIHYCELVNECPIIVRARDSVYLESIASTRTLINYYPNGTIAPSIGWRLKTKQGERLVVGWCLQPFSIG